MASGVMTKPSRRIKPDVSWRKQPGGVDDLMRRARSIRIAEGITQYQMADYMETIQGQVSMLENLEPRDVFVGTLVRYLEGLGMRLVLHMEPIYEEDTDG